MSIAARVDDKSSARRSVANVLDRQPPCNVQAERCVLGSILLLPDVCDDVVLLLRSADFYDDANRILFDRILRMHDAGRKIDAALLVEELKKDSAFDDIGGAAYLARIADSVPSAAHAVYYAKIVREHAMSRMLIEASTETLRDAYDSGRSSSELISQAEQRVFSILESRGHATVTNLRDILHEAMDRLDARMKGEHLEGVVETGFSDLDHLIGGLHASELVILAARPAMGKTALALNIAEHVAISRDTPVLFVSLEMSALELGDRLLCSLARVNGRRVRNGTLSREDRVRLVNKAGEISESPLFVDDSPARTVTEIAAASRRIKRREKQLGLIVIDYLQLIEPDNSNDARQEQVAKIARRLKGMARELKVPVLCLAQLNRQAEATRDNRPRLSHLRESGAIEQDADVVMFVHREEYFLSKGEQDQQQVERSSGDGTEAQIIVAKQRHGPIGDIELLWHKEFTRFVNLASKSHEEFDQFNVAETF